ncbi:MAG: outer membrane beta-barrel protein [Fulvivirga sp.]|uniref:outer membrane beta-barrel protein n=1 Tax=Fulvivirga sp. TaxID=1931237 RepID=UPI0032ECBEF8
MTELKIACICLFMLLLCTIESAAQVQKGDSNLGLGFDTNSLSGDNGESRTNIFLNYTYFIGKRISLGVGPRFGWLKDANDQKSNSIGYNVFLNYAFVSESGIAMPYFGGQFTKVSQKSEGNDDPLVTNSIGGNIGIRFFLTERLNLDNNFSYTRVISGNDTLDDLGIDADGTVIQLNVGLGYILGKR